MAKKRGNPDIVELGKKTRFTAKSAAAAARKSNEVQNKRRSMFASLRALTDKPVSDKALLTPSVVKFWVNRGIDDDAITPIMAETTAIYADALRNGDLDALLALYKLYGLTYESNREHNVNLSVGNAEDKPFEINYIVNGKKVSEDKLEA